jgi:integrase
LGEALALQWADIIDGTAYVRRSKNEDPRTVRLRDDLAPALEARRKPEGAVFRFHYGGQLKVLLKRATCLACGVAPPKRNVPSPMHRLRWVNFHTYEISAPSERPIQSRRMALMPSGQSSSSRFGARGAKLHEQFLAVDIHGRDLLEARP